jgi:hypothetical protein
LIPPNFDPVPRKFRKMDKAYPLTKFREYLLLTLAPSTAKVYVGEIRRLLFNLGEGELNDDGQKRTHTWDDRTAVLKYKQEHCLHDRRGFFTSAFGHWLKFTRSPVLRTVSSRMSKHCVAAALRALINARLTGGPAFPLEEYPNLRWGKTRGDGSWCFYHLDRPDAEFIVYPKYQPLLTLIRDWGLTSVGEPLLPSHEGSKVPMSTHEISNFIEREINHSVVADMVAIMQEAEEEAIGRHGFVPPKQPVGQPMVRAGEKFRTPPSGIMIPSDEGDGFKVFGRGPNAKVVYDRDAEYEDYVVPADGPLETEN